MTAEEVAALLVADNPTAEPLELDHELANRLIAEATAAAPDDAFLAQVLVAWERLIP